MTLRRVTALAFVILILTSINSQAQQQRSAAQPNQTLNANANVNSAYNPSFGRLSLQFGSGLLFGSTGGGAGGLLGIAIFAPRSGGSGAGFVTLGIGVLGAVTDIQSVLPWAFML